MDDDVKKAVQKAVSWVPQIFYDLIARVVPGFVSFIFLTAAIMGSSKFLEQIQAIKYEESFASAGLILLAGLALSYALAVLLSGLRFLYILSFRHIVYYGLLKKKKDEIVKDIETGVVDEDRNFWKKYDFIKKEFPPAGNRITKLKAEIHMSHVLMVGSLLSLIYPFITLSFNMNEVYISLFYLIVILGSLGASQHFKSRMTSEVDNYASLLGYDEWRNKLLKKADAWNEFFRLGEALMESDTEESETLTSAVLSMRR